MQSLEIGLSILAKAPIPGFSKTRLIPLLGEAGAASLQARFIERTFQIARLAATGPITLWYTPEDSVDYFARFACPGSVRLLPQHDEDLGARMNRCVTERVARGGELVIGTDCPCIEASDLDAAARALVAEFEAVLFPAEDGGYGLIGLQVPDIRVFQGVSWSSENVLEDTRQNLQRLGKRWGELLSVWDIDRPADIVRLANSPVAYLLEGIYA